MEVEILMHLRTENDQSMTNNSDRKNELATE